MKKAGSDFEVWIRQTFQESSKDFAFTVSSEVKSNDSAETTSHLKHKLIWKKIDGKFKIRLGEIPLKPLDIGLVHADIFNTALSQIQVSTKKAQVIENRENDLKNDLSNYQKQMIQFRDDKNTLEDKLYEAFLPILNSKKDEIRRLKRKVRVK